MVREEVRLVCERKGKIMAVQRISQDELDRLGIDEKQRLYWDGKEIVTRTEFFLGNIVVTAAWVAAGAASVSALVNAAKFVIVDMRYEMLRALWMMKCGGANAAKRKFMAVNWPEGVRRVSIDELD
jgi:hypothetical protein